MCPNGTCVLRRQCLTLRASEQSHSGRGGGGHQFTGVLLRAGNTETGSTISRGIQPVKPSATAPPLVLAHRDQPGLHTHGRPGLSRNCQTPTTATSLELTLHCCQSKSTWKLIPCHRTDQRFFFLKLGVDRVIVKLVLCLKTLSSSL